MEWQNDEMIKPQNYKITESQDYKNNKNGESDKFTKWR
jgi:hypothetical protein